jgi:S-adenosylmethionine/arginine decarboxylase-like enzyme
VKIVGLSTPSLRFLLTNLQKSLFKSNHFSIRGHLDFLIDEGGPRGMATRPALKEAATPWGLLTSLDLYDCNPDTIRDANKIKQYVVELCTLIDMKRFGDCQVVHFGEEERVAGYSMIQLIETSLISGHFANLTNSAYIDIFSCKAYDPNTVAEFTRKFFRAGFVELHVTKRM